MVNNITGGSGLRCQPDRRPNRRETMGFGMNEVAAQVFRMADQHPMALTRDAHSRIAQGAELLNGAVTADLFPNAAAPEAALTGLWLGIGDWERAHELAQDIDSADGYYWHAIVHRQEPDPWNSRYWFNKAGMHPIYPELARVGDDKLGLAGPWDAGRFVDLCGEAAGTEREPAVREVQQAEWRLLLLHCARSAGH